MSRNLWEGVPHCGTFAEPNELDPYLNAESQSKADRTIRVSVEGVSETEFLRKQ
ncbi:MAG: hypothetical protein JSW49_03180 [candidate division WOR-3 bacterium]|nr:MAG: hypothetical protein JSW49_03180 [candidate division WOR-3 bacterium]